MSSAKDIMIRPISSRVAREVVARHHYSGKSVNNSQVHLGVFLGASLEGALQFGPPLDRRKLLGLVEGTRWDGCLELNRMAFSDRLPRNSESRALAVSMRLLRRHAPQVEWVVSYADGTQCGHGTIYQASGFWLTGIQNNTTLWAAPSGEVFADASLKKGIGGTEQQQRARQIASRTTPANGGGSLENGAASMKAYREAGWRPMPGFQLRYMYPLNPTVRERLTVPILPYSKVDEMGARMYRGSRVEGDTRDTTGDQPGERGATPTSTLQGDIDG